MSADHKAALAQGRLESKVVREYLEALRNSKPKRGRKRSAETIQKRLDKIETELASADPLNELLLVQERRDLQDEFENLGSGNDLSDAENAFVSIAKSYSERRHISYATWREIGVDAAVLKRAEDAKLLSVLWDVDTVDWTRPSTEQIVQTAVANAGPGSIILMHDGGGNRASTVAAIPKIVSQLRAKGYEFATVGDLVISDPPGSDDMSSDSRSTQQ